MSIQTKLPICHYPSLLTPKSPSFLQYSKNTTTSHKHNQTRAIKLKPTRIKASSMASTPSTASDDDNNTQTTKPFSVLFVCLGNICRSPAAEGVFRHLVNKKNLDSKFYIDSAGTIDFHEGNQADPRMRSASKKRGIEITSISRPIRPSDFKDFDLILAMDKQNREDILDAFERWRHREPLPADADKKVRLMCSYCKKHDETEVPDPYYGGPQGFVKVLDLLEDACASLLESIVAEKI
ncbi:putative low molecular weight protein-tyrosine-phosphatase slr0328 [Phtheirospermum japonicum]|uniref:acid phosphatase n=1 Tax=Phtheirospermum japonicum TaxID=374723 RepID=A0A830CQD4_9LAMI|nr:putative low molecular weight protein-tyrosine-phosphatase slr0328 [Phtheirospermum japonicum]